MRRSPILLLLAACSTGDGSTPRDTDSDTDGSVDLPEDTFPEEPADSDPPDDGGGGGGGNNGIPGVPGTPCTAPAAPGLEGACDFSVHDASATVDETGDRPLVLEVRQSLQHAQPGAYNGPGIGNRAIAGFHGYNRRPLSDLGAISFVVRPLTTAFEPELALQVDLECPSSGSGQLRMLTVASRHFVTKTSLGGGRARWAAPFDQTIWTSATEILHPDTREPLLYLTNDALDRTRSLAPLLEAYPRACVRNISGGFADLPAGKVTSGVLLTLGSRTVNSLGAAWEVHEVVIGEDVHLPPE